jgi:hypothetical protein
VIKKFVYLFFIYLIFIPLSMDLFASTQVGIKGGINFTNLIFSGDPGINFINKAGFQAGIFSVINISGHLAFQPEIYFCSKGAKAKEGERTLFMKHDYIEVPLFLKLNLFRTIKGEKKLNPYLLLGGYASGNLSAKSIVEGPGFADEEDDSDLYKNYDAGFITGVGMEYPLGPGKITIEGRFSRGFQNMSEPEIEIYSVKNQTLAFLLGYSFSLSR